MSCVASIRHSGWKCYFNLNQLRLTQLVRNSSHSSKSGQDKGSHGHYDAVIVGGGPAGLSIACAIAKNPKLAEHRVLLLDGAPSFKGYSPDSYSNRVYALNQSTIDLLKSLDAWSTITDIRHQPVKKMQVWDSSSDAMIKFQGDSIVDDMAFIVENDVLVHSLLQQIKKHDNITLQNGSKIEAVQLATATQNLGYVTLQTGEEYSCNLMIGADGANSIVRRQMGVEIFSESYNQMGVIATVNLNSTGVNQTAWQRFLPNGVLAILPLADGLSSIVWSTSTSHAKELLKMSAVEFVDAINDALFKAHPKSDILNSLQSSLVSVLGKQAEAEQKQMPPAIESLYGGDSRAAFPLAFSHSSAYVSDGTALIGDSAHRVHPLAGQGLNLGFGDVHSLTKHLAEGAYGGFAIGDLTPLKKYESERLRHNLPIMIGIHALQKLYSIDLAPVVWARSLGLQMAQSIEPIKKLFMDRARV